MSKAHMCTDESQKAERWKSAKKTKKKRTFIKMGGKCLSLLPIFSFLYIILSMLYLHWFLLLTIKTCSPNVLGTLNIIKYILNNISVNYPCVQTHSSSM